MVWLPRLVAPKVRGHSFLAMYCLAICISVSHFKKKIIFESFKKHSKQKKKNDSVQSDGSLSTLGPPVYTHFLSILLTNLGFPTKLVVINGLILDAIIFYFKLCPKFRLYVFSIYSPS